MSRSNDPLGLSRILKLSLDAVVRAKTHTQVGQDESKAGSTSGNKYKEGIQDAEKVTTEDLKSNDEYSCTKDVCKKPPHKSSRGRGRSLAGTSIQQQKCLVNPASNEGNNQFVGSHSVGNPDVFAEGVSPPSLACSLDHSEEHSRVKIVCGEEHKAALKKQEVHELPDLVKCQVSPEAVNDMSNKAEISSDISDMRQPVISNVLSLDHLEVNKKTATKEGNPIISVTNGSANNSLSGRHYSVHEKNNVQKTPSPSELPRKGKQVPSYRSMHKKRKRQIFQSYGKVDMSQFKTTANFSEIEAAKCPQQSPLENQGRAHRDMSSTVSDCVQENQYESKRSLDRACFKSQTHFLSRQDTDHKKSQKQFAFRQGRHSFSEIQNKGEYNRAVNFVGQGCEGTQETSATDTLFFETVCEPTDPYENDTRLKENLGDLKLTEHLNDKIPLNVTMNQDTETSEPAPCEPSVQRMVSAIYKSYLQNDDTQPQTVHIRKTTEIECQSGEYFSSAKGVTTICQDSVAEKSRETLRSDTNMLTEDDINSNVLEGDARSHHELDKDLRNHLEMEKDVRNHLEMEKDTRNHREMEKDTRNHREMEKDTRNHREMENNSRSRHKIEKDARSFHEMEKDARSHHELEKYDRSHREFEKDDRSHCEIKKDKRSNHEMKNNTRSHCEKGYDARNYHKMGKYASSYLKMDKYFQSHHGMGAYARKHHEMDNRSNHEMEKYARSQCKVENNTRSHHGMEKIVTSYHKMEKCDGKNHDMDKDSRSCHEMKTYARSYHEVDKNTRGLHEIDKDTRCHQEMDKDTRRNHEMDKDTRRHLETVKDTKTHQEMDKGTKNHQEIDKGTKNHHEMDKDTGNHHEIDKDTRSHHEIDKDTTRINHELGKDTRRNHKMNKDTGNHHEMDIDTRRNHELDKDTRRSHEMGEDTRRHLETVKDTRRHLETVKDTRHRHEIDKGTKNHHEVDKDTKNHHKMNKDIGNLHEMDKYAISHHERDKDTGNHYEMDKDTIRHKMDKDTGAHYEMEKYTKNHELYKETKNHTEMDKDTGRYCEMDKDTGNLHEMDKNTRSHHEISITGKLSVVKSEANKVQKLDCAELRMEARGNDTESTDDVLSASLVNKTSLQTSHSSGVCSRSSSDFSNSAWPEVRSTYKADFHYPSVPGKMSPPRGFPDIQNWSSSDSNKTSPHYHTSPCDELSPVANDLPSKPIVQPDPAEEASDKEHKASFVDPFFRELNVPAKTVGSKLAMDNIDAFLKSCSAEVKEYLNTYNQDHPTDVTIRVSLTSPTSPDFVPRLSSHNSTSLSKTFRPHCYSSSYMFPPPMSMPVPPFYWYYWPWSEWYSQNMGANSNSVPFHNSYHPRMMYPPPSQESRDRRVPSPDYLNPWTHSYLRAPPYDYQHQGPRRGHPDPCDPSYTWRDYWTGDKAAMFNNKNYQVPGPQVDQARMDIEHVSKGESNQSSDKFTDAVCSSDAGKCYPGDNMSTDSHLEQTNVPVIDSKLTKEFVETREKSESPIVRKRYQDVHKQSPPAREMKTWSQVKRQKNDHEPGTPQMKFIEGQLLTPDVTHRSSPSESYSSGELPQNKKILQAQQWAESFVARSRNYQHTFIDSHCHIDLLYSRLDIQRETTFSTFREEHSDTFPHNYEGCVAVFCNPNTFTADNPKNQILKTLAAEDGIWLAVGCHPKNATEFLESHLLGLRETLKHPKVVALGEIGLDYSGMFSEHSEIQKQVFRQQLHLALELKLPIVIHCRDADDDCLEILVQTVPRDHKIHAHCFTRDITVARRWMLPFPNLFLGLTPLITYKTARDAANTATHAPLDRLLLETDTPYFLPSSVRRNSQEFSHPGFALYTAEKVAELRNISVDAVLKACRDNTRKMYGI